MIPTAYQDPDKMDDQARLANLIREVSARLAQQEANNPTPPPPPEPYVDKPGSLIAAENDLLGYEMCRKIHLAFCRDAGKCEDARCRRAGRCREVDQLDPAINEARAALAAEQAKWKPPAAAPASQPRRKKRRAAGGRSSRRR